MSSATYSVQVGNVGNVYSGRNLMTAQTVFAEYVEQSVTNYGRAAGESVTLFESNPKADGLILREHVGHCAHI
jgi:hypothetical protein